MAVYFGEGVGRRWGVVTDPSCVLTGVLVKQCDNDAKVDFALYGRKTLLSKFLIQFKLAFGVNSLRSKSDKIHLQFAAVSVEWCDAVIFIRTFSLKGN